MEFAEAESCLIVSPAMREGELDYDLALFAEQFVQKMSSACRRGVASGVCFMVHRRAFDTVGGFDEKLGLAGYEDHDFFRRARLDGFRLAITGRAFLHHFGSVTQDSVKARHPSRDGRLADRAYYLKKIGETWPRRKGTQLREKARGAWWVLSERLRYGHTLKEQRLGGVTRYH